MHAFARHLHRAPGTTPARATRGLILDQGWRYDLLVGFCDIALFRGQLRQLWRRTADLANIQPGASVLDVGCGTGTLALAVQRRVGTAGRVCGIDPGARQIARARAKAARRALPIEFQLGVVEQLPFPDQTFDAVLSSLMMHHLPASLKRQGLAEISRVLKPGGRLVIADFPSQRERHGPAAHFHAGGSSVQDLATIVRDAGFAPVDTETLRPRRFSAFPGAVLLKAVKPS